MRNSHYRQRYFRHVPVVMALVLALVLMPLVIGCGGGGRPPKPLSHDEIGPAVQRVFQDAQDDLRAGANDLVAALEAGEDSRAFLLLQSLLNRAELTAEQRDVVSRSMISIGARLNEAADAGDAGATQLLEYHGATK